MRVKILFGFLACLTILLVPLACIHPRTKLEFDRANRLSEDIFTRAARSSVIIRTPSGLGSGTVIWASDKYYLILTCAHVLDEEEPSKFRIQVSTETKTQLFGGFVEKIDKEWDLALVVGLGDIDLPAVSIASLEPRLYERLYLIGAPMGFNRSATEGVLSSKTDGIEGKEHKIWRVTGGFLYPGISGGTIVNSRGELVCVPETVMLFKGLVPMPQLGFCVPLGAIKTLVKGYIL